MPFYSWEVWVSLINHPQHFTSCVFHYYYYYYYYDFSMKLSLRRLRKYFFRCIRTISAGFVNHRHTYTYTRLDNNFYVGKKFLIITFSYLIVFIEFWEKKILTSEILILFFRERSAVVRKSKLSSGPGTFRRRAKQ